AGARAGRTRVGRAGQHARAIAIAGAIRTTVRSGRPVRCRTVQRRRDALTKPTAAIDDRVGRIRRTARGVVAVDLAAVVIVGRHVAAPVIAATLAHAVASGVAADVVAIQAGHTVLGTTVVVHAARITQT